jgi:sugar phosphate isomerase/epimerase
LIRAVGRPAFAVHLDVCNVINSPRRFYESGAVIRECFQKLGRWIISCHAKDLQWIPEYNVHFLEVVPGRGQVDYRAYLTELGKLPLDAPFMLEHLKNAAEYDEGRAYIQRVAGEAGVAFA